MRSPRGCLIRRTLPGIDGDRVGLFGSSLGGGLAFALATEDPRIRAIALAVPMLDGLIATPAPVGARPRLIAAIARDALGRRRGQPPVLLPVFGDAGSNAIIQREVDEFYAAVDEVEGLSGSLRGNMRTTRTSASGEIRPRLRSFSA